MLGRSTLNQLVQGTVDRTTLTLLFVCWGLTIVISAMGGGFFLLFAVVGFLNTRPNMVETNSEMALACAVVPYVVSRAIEGFFGRAGQLAEALDERRRTRETAP